LVERYRQNAEKCLQLVQKFNDLEAKRSLLVMANAWLMLAAQREKTIGGVQRGEPTFPVNEPPPPHEPPTPPAIDEPQPPPIKEPTPLKEPPPQRMDAANPDDSMQS
jgi:hypothetical protein